MGIVLGLVKKAVPDGLYNKLKVFKNAGYWPNINHPVTFNEKMQWLKMHNRTDKYTRLVDKIQSKEFCSNILGNRYSIPLLGVWNRFDDIDFNTLPSQFVLKTNNDCGGVLICDDKEALNLKNAKRFINHHLSNNYFNEGREWSYKYIEPKIFAEEYLGANIKDYKLFVFNSKVKYIQVDFDRFINHRRNFYDTNWEYAPFTTCYPSDPKVIVEKPECLDEMIGCAKKIAEKIGDIPFVRIDMFVVDNIPKIGEITLYHGAGYEKFMPKEWDAKLGELLSL